MGGILMHKKTIIELENRRDRLKNNEEDNLNIVKKLNRKIRKLENLKVE